MELPFRHILTVSELTQEIKNLLEINFSEVWVEGEISNLRIPPSGHLYFTLKDDMSQIRAVLFRMQARILRFHLQDGLHVICKGRVSLYEKRGDYQLILDTMEPKGVGPLQLAFLQLKEKLEKEGLFDPLHKKRVPMIPKKIGIVTSPTGAVIKDMLHILHRRFENLHILIYPVRVQGEGASLEIVEAIQFFNTSLEVDVIIVGRGGGSFEDLWSFNEEKVVRAIYHSKIPIISAVGHETDYTLSDFVADLRAPTPSAAAELVVKDKREIENTLRHLRARLEGRTLEGLQKHRTNLFYLGKIFLYPKKRIENYFLRTDELGSRLTLLASWTFKGNRETFQNLRERIYIQNPTQRIERIRGMISQWDRYLEKNMVHSIETQKQTLRRVWGKLESLSPLSILQRGYSITRKIPSLQILRDAAHVQQGDRVEVKLYLGNLTCSVMETSKS